MIEKMVRPAGLEPATPGLGNRFWYFQKVTIHESAEQIHSEALRQTPLEYAGMGAKVTSLLTSWPWFRRYQLRRRLYRLCRPYMNDRM